MHLILISSEILSCAHKLVSSCAPPILCTLNSFLINDRHLVEVILCKIEVLSSFWLHLLAIVEIDWQLLYLETIFIRDFVSHASVGLNYLRFLSLLVVVVERDLGVALVRRHFGTINWLLVPHVQCVHVLGVLVLLLALPRLDYSLCLDICFLTSRSSSWGHTLTISYWANWFISSWSIIRIWIEIITCSG